MKSKSKSKNEGVEHSLQRHAWMGAGLGLYFGMFFRPAREPSVWIVIGLSILITVVMFVFRLFRKNRPPMMEILKEAGLNFLQYLLILAVFEGRHFAWDYGGRIATTILTTVMGAVTGALIYWKSNGKVTGI